MNARPALRMRQLIRSPAAVAVFLFLLTFAVRIWDIDMPLERDEGEYAYAAQDLARGFMPYRESFCQKPPVIFFWYLAAFHLFGESVAGIHAMLIVAAWLASVGLFLIARRLLGQREGVAAAALFGICSAGYGYFGSAANTEVFMLVPGLFGVHAAMVAMDRRRWREWLAAGALLAVAALTKQVAFFLAAGPAVCFLILLLRRRDFLGIAVGAAAAATGALAVGAACAAWLAANGALTVMVQAVFEHNLAYTAGAFGGWKWQRLAAVFADRFLWSDGALWLAAGGGCLLLATRRGWASLALPFGAVWLAGSIPGVAAGPYAFGHYFIQILPPLVLLAAALAQAAERAPLLPRRARGAIAAGVMAAIALPALAARVPWILKPVDERSEVLYGVYGPSPFVAAREVAEVVRRLTQPSERILIFGSEPEILFYANRRSVTRFTIMYPLTGLYPDSAAMVEELVRELGAHPPAAVVVCASPSTFISVAAAHTLWERLAAERLAGYEIRSTESGAPGAPLVLLVLTPHGQKKEP